MKQRDETVSFEGSKTSQKTETIKLRDAIENMETRDESVSYPKEQGLWKVLHDVV